MIKPRISYDTEFQVYTCMLDWQDLHSWPIVGIGDTVEEAFKNWYIKQIGTDIVSDGTDEATE